MRGLCEDVGGSPLWEPPPSGGRAVMKHTGTRAVEVVPRTCSPPCAHSRAQGCRVRGTAFRSGRGVYVGGGKRCQTPRCHAGGTSLPMQLIREDVSEEVAFAQGLKVGLGQRAGKRARRREPGNLGMDGSSLAVGGELAAPLFLIVEGPESLPLAFEL